MKPSAFAYHRPATLAEAVHLLAELAPEDGRILAGGQSLMPVMAFRLARPQHLIDINSLTELQALRLENGTLTIGACIRHSRFQRPITDGPLGLLLAEIMHHIAHYPIRTRGTFCGSLANADPASEWCLVAATLGATLMAQNAFGHRAIPASEFFRSAMMTVLAADEILVEAQIPELPSDTRFGFEEFSRRPGDYAMAMALVTFRVVEGKIVEPRLGIGGAEDTPRRIPEAEAMLLGRAPSEAVFTAAAEQAAASIDPITDHQTSAAYRRHLVKAVTKRALQRTSRQAGP